MHSGQRAPPPRSQRAPGWRRHVSQTTPSARARLHALSCTPLPRAEPATRVTALLGCAAGTLRSRCKLACSGGRPTPARAGRHSGRHSVLHGVLHSVLVLPATAPWHSAGHSLAGVSVHAIEYGRRRHLRIGLPGRHLTRTHAHASSTTLASAHSRKTSSRKHAQVAPPTTAARPAPRSASCRACAAWTGPP